MNSFEKRYWLSDTICSRLGELFSQDQVEIIPFGMEKIAGDSQALRAYLGSSESYYSRSATLIEFAPDYILLKKTQPRAVYFLEVKVSKTPLWSKGLFNEIKVAHPEVKLSDIGDVARETFNAYYNLFPNTIILDACTYNPNLLTAQFVDKIKCLRCFKSAGEGVDCSNCPMKRGEAFPYGRNFNSKGSKTPHTNIDLGSFCDVEKFFSGLGISVDVTALNSIKEQIKAAGVYIPPDKCPDREQVIGQLVSEGCLWAK